jgi:hypothetical protein
MSSADPTCIGITCLGYNSQPNGTEAYQVVLGSADTQHVYYHGTISNFSDARLKKNIESLTLGLDFIKDLRPTTYTWIKTNADETGFIAQEVLAAEQKHNAKVSIVVTSNPESYALKEGKIIASLVKAVQELSAKVDELEGKLNRM